MNKLIPLAILCALQAGDIISTRIAIAHGAVEMNPLVGHLGLWPAKLLVFLAAALLAYRARKTWLMWAGCAVYAAIVASNLLVAIRGGVR